VFLVRSISFKALKLQLRHNDGDIARGIGPEDRSTYLSGVIEHVFSPLATAG
jgi:hypothetical protein